MTTLNYNHYRYRMLHLLGDFEQFTYKSRHKKFYTLNSFKDEIRSFFEINTVVSMNSLPILGTNVHNIKNNVLMNLLAFNVGILGTKK